MGAFLGESVRALGWPLTAFLIATCGALVGIAIGAGVAMSIALDYCH